MDDSELNRVSGDINNWSLQFLEKVSHYPVNGEYTAGHLVNRFIFHVVVRKDLDVESAVAYDLNLLDTMNKRYSDIGIATDNVVGDVFHGGAKRKIQRALSIYLENQPNILLEGDRRGRLYRHKLTRPRIKPKDIATYIAKWMDLSGEEVHIRDPGIGNKVIAWATEFHLSQETGTTSNTTTLSSALEQYPQGQTSLKFSFEDDAIMQNYQTNFNSNLSEWCNNVYTNHWYKSIASNVLRYLRKEFDCIAEGSKRGRWIHKNHHITNLIEKDGYAMFDAASEIAELLQRFSIVHKKISNIENLEFRKSIANVLESHIQLMQRHIDNANKQMFTGTETWSRDSSELTLEEYLDRNHGIEPPKKETMRDKIKKFLGDRPRNTSEILEHINHTLRHGTTNEHLENILAKDKNFVKVGFIKRSNILNGEIDIAEWATRTWVSENVPDFDDEMHKIANSESGVQS